MSAFKHIFATVKFNTDPLIGRMTTLTMRSDGFREDFARLMKEKRAFVFVPCGTLHVTLHPSDELLDAYYKAMGAT